MAKKRIDVILVEKEYYETRNQAQAALMAGRVFVNGRKIDKSGEKFDELAEINVVEEFPYVSRGALKLQTAYENFNLDFQNKVAMDIGASTGGFTDFMLQHGIIKVYALDVGYGQLHYKLRNNSQVINIEKTNVRNYDNPELYEKIDIMTGDLSFISITKVYENVRKYVKNNGEIILLVKPQFEAGKSQVGKKGLISDKNVYREVLDKVIKFIENTGDVVENICISGIKGAKSGNTEFLIKILKNSETEVCNLEGKIEKLLEEI
ncbi:MAG: TlyA family RNA methyltransferase [Candidatus Muiribacteriota bacterium]